MILLLSLNIISHLFVVRPFLALNKWMITGHLVLGNFWKAIVHNFAALMFEQRIFAKNLKTKAVKIEELQKLFTFFISRLKQPTE